MLLNIILKVIVHLCRSFQPLGLCIRLLLLRRQQDSRFGDWSPLSILTFSFHPMDTSLYYILQALVQFSDAETATSAKDALDGRSIPR